MNTRWSALAGLALALVPVTAFAQSTGTYIDPSTGTAVVQTPQGGVSVQPGQVIVQTPQGVATPQQVVTQGQQVVTQGAQVVTQTVPVTVQQQPYVVQQQQPYVVQQQQPQYVVQQQPQYVVQQPVMYGGYPMMRRPRLRYVPYTGGPIPQGARLDDRPNWALVGTGVGLFGASWVPSLFVGLICMPGWCGPTAPWLVLPVAGPWIALAGSNQTTAPILVLGGLMQGVGFALMIAGAVVRQRTVVYEEYASRGRDRRVAWSITPTTSPTSVGVNLQLTHF